MRATNKRQEPARAVRLIIADAARATRSQLRQCHLPVDPNLDALASSRRGTATARQLVLLTDEMIRAHGPNEAKQRFAEMGARMIDARLAG